MKVLKSRLAIGLAAVAIAAFGFAVIGTVFSEDQAEAKSRDRQVSSSNVYRFADGSVVDGASATLVRTRDGIAATVDT